MTLLVVVLAVYFAIGTGMLAWMLGDPAIRADFGQMESSEIAGYVIFIVCLWPVLFVEV